MTKLKTIANNGEVLNLLNVPEEEVSLADAALRTAGKEVHLEVEE